MARPSLIGGIGDALQKLLRYLPFFLHIHYRSRDKLSPALEMGVEMEIALAGCEGS